MVKEFSPLIPSLDTRGEKKVVSKMVRCALRDKDLKPQNRFSLWPLPPVVPFSDTTILCFPPLFTFSSLSFRHHSLTMKQPVILFIFIFLIHLKSSRVLSWQLPEIHTLIDLTHPLNNNTLHWLTLRPFEMKITHNGTKVKGKYSYW